MANPMQELLSLDMSVWLDFLSRDMLDSGELKQMINEGIRGQTSNPSIFKQAIAGGSQCYVNAIRAAASRGLSAPEVCWELMIEDVQRACDCFRPVYEESGGYDGYVSLELDPTKADDTEGSIKQARVLWERVGKKNLLLKVPATKAGLPVIERLLREGMNVNVTLLFSVKRYEEVMEAYFKALEGRLAEGKSVDNIFSVASFFVSRVDTEADKRMDKVQDKVGSAVNALRGRVAVANALVAYEKFEEHFSGSRWEALRSKGANLQRPLWASTSTKNPSYSDILYVQELIGPHCVNTMPQKTLAAFLDHGRVERTITPQAIENAHKVLDELASIGVDIDDITLNTLVREGVKKFADAYHDLLNAIRAQMGERVVS